MLPVASAVIFLFHNFQRPRHHLSSLPYFKESVRWSKLIKFERNRIILLINLVIKDCMIIIKSIYSYKSLNNSGI